MINSYLSDSYCCPAMLTQIYICDTAFTFGFASLAPPGFPLQGIHTYWYKRRCQRKPPIHCQSLLYRRVHPAEHQRFHRSIDTLQECSKRLNFMQMCSDAVQQQLVGANQECLDFRMNQSRDSVYRQM